MQGRSDQNDDSWDKAASRKMAALNGTGKHPAFDGTGKYRALNGTGKHPALDGTGKQRAIPQRPPGMARLDTVPEMPRVPRPQRQAEPPKNLRRRWLIFGSLFAVAAILACTITYVLASGMISSAGPATTATDFLTALKSHNYDQAYKDLGPAITIRISPQQFTQQGQAADNCWGTITDYKQIDNSATNNGSSQSYAYTITRSKIPKTYEMRLTFQQDPDDSNAWKISDYGAGLGPTQAAPACVK